MQPQPYYAFMAGQAECLSCGWSGPARETRQLEIMDFGTEQGCPACGTYLALTEFPLADEAAQDPAVPEADRAIARLTLTLCERAMAAELKDIAQLPELDPMPLVLAWDIEGRGLGNTWAVIRAGGVEVWREHSAYEDFDRAAEVIALLQRRYPTLRRVEFSPRAFHDLCGDALHAPRYLDGINARLAAGDPVQI